MEYDFPRFELTDSLKAWLSELYTAYKQDSYFDPRHIGRKLWKYLSKDFNPNDIPGALAGYSHITPIGIWHLDPQTEIFDQIDTIFYGLQKLLVEKYSEDIIEIDELASLSKIESGEIKRILEMIISISSLRGELRIQSK